MTVSSLRELLVPAHGHRGRSWRSVGCSWRMACCASARATARRAGRSAAPAKPGPDNSTLDAPLFYQLLIGEIELSAGQAGMPTRSCSTPRGARATRQLFRRATDIALQARAGEQALAATRAWRQAAPASIDARRCSCRSCCR